MAVSVLGTATFNTSNGTKTVTATPAVGDLIIIVTAHSGNTSDATPTDDNSSGTYKQIINAVKNSSADKLAIYVREQFIVAASSTIFSHAPGTTSGGGLVIFKVTGMARVALLAILQSAKQDNVASGTPAPAFTNAVNTNNAVIGAVFNATNPAGLTPRASFTEDPTPDLGYNTPPSGLETMRRDSGETGSTMTWGGASPSAFCSAVIEIDTSYGIPILVTQLGVRT